MYRIRFIWLMLRCLFIRKTEITEPFTQKFWALPLLDTDVTRLFTQTYGQLMGLARWQCVFGTTLRQVALKNRWAPVTTSETITYHRAIKWFSRITLTTQIITWDEKRFYVEHRFLVKGKLCADCIVEGVIRAPDGIKKPGEVFAATGIDEEPAPFPEKLSLWVRSLRDKKVQ